MSKRKPRIWNKKLVPLDDRKLLEIILEMRRDSQNSIELVDEFKIALRNRKVVLKYSNNTEEKFICLTSNIVNQLRSFFIETSSGDSNVSEYLHDVFVSDIYNIELFTIE